MAKRFCLKSATFLSLILSCYSLSSQTLEDKFKKSLSNSYDSYKNAVGIVISVQSKKNRIFWTEAIGYSDIKSKDTLKPNHPVLIASNTKTFVAAAIMKLVELDKIQLKDDIQNLVFPSTKNLFLDAGYALNNITIEHLLSHTSGIQDYVDSTYFDFVDKHPNHRWLRADQIKLSSEKGLPLALPGTKFSYGDINYLLLTEIIEKKTDMPFYTAIRELIDFEKLGLNYIWFVNLEDAPKDILPMAHQYWNKKGWDSRNINPSWDLYGGGGIASTVSDLALFFQKLFNGEIIKDSKLLKKMSDYVLPIEKSNYCIGLRKISFHGFTAYYHGGFWGTDAMYLPEYDLTIAICTLQKDSRDLNAELSHEIIKIMEKININ